MVGEDDLAGILERDLQIAVAVLQGIADQVAEEAGAGTAAERPPDFFFRKCDPGSDLPLPENCVKGGNTLLQQTVQDDGFGGRSIRR